MGERIFCRQQRLVSEVSSGLLCINLSVLVARRFIFEQFGGAGASSSNADGLEIATTYFGSQLKKVEMLTFMYKILLVLCEFCCISLSCRDCDQIVDCHNNAI
ncbi:hypothetical protein M758_9G055300 [Ceratodon purpureus]|nr:hypothetical protein M758_9G055300 [Ceratodon purpureus]